MIKTKLRLSCDFCGKVFEGKKAKTKAVLRGKAAKAGWTANPGQSSDRCPDCRGEVKTGPKARRPVYVLDTSTMTQKKFRSAKEAGKYVGVSRNAVRLGISSKRFVRNIFLVSFDRIDEEAAPSPPIRGRKRVPKYAQ